MPPPDPAPPDPTLSHVGPGEPVTLAPTTRPGHALPGDWSPPGYVLVNEIARGGFGVVYLARQTALQREVALKVILSGSHAGDEELARFRTEVEAIARLQHPGIVQVFEVGEHQGRPYFAMEYCAARSLDRRMGGTPLQPAEAAALVERLARAVAAAHQANVVHRDLKPSNILLAADGSPKVTDFGLAKKLDEVGRTQTGAVLGTPSYMAPEQAIGSRDIGPAADVYAVGAILYECLTGRPPFKAATAFDTILQVGTQEPVPPTQLNAKAPPDLETICLKCLQKDQARRYSSAGDLADDLARFQRGEPIRARPVGRVEQAIKWVRRNPVVSAQAVVLFLSLTAGVIISSLFALDARREARNANDKAKEAAREKQKAEESAALARENEQKAERALDEVELTLIDGLLRPLGRKTAPLLGGGGLQLGLQLGGGQVGAVGFGGQLGSGLQFAGQTGLTNLGGQIGWPTAGGGQLGIYGGAPGGLGPAADRILDPAEPELFAKLAGMKSQRTRLRFLEEGTKGPAVATRIELRAAWVAQSLVGLDQGRRKEVARLLLSRLRAPDAPKEARRACISLGIALHLRDEAFVRPASEVLLADLGEKDPVKLVRVCGQLRGLFALAPDRAPGWALTAALALITAAEQKDGVTSDALHQELYSISPYLDTRGAVRATDAVARIPATQISVDWYHPVTQNLDASGALESTRDLLARMATATDSSDIWALRSGLIRVSERLDAAQAARAGEAVLAFIKATNNPGKLWHTTQALPTIWGLAQPPLAAQQATEAADRLHVVLEASKEPATGRMIAAALGAVAEHLPEVKARETAEILLSLMRKPTGQPKLSTLAASLTGALTRCAEPARGRLADEAAIVLLARLSKDHPTAKKGVSSPSLRELEFLARWLTPAGAARVFEELTRQLETTSDASTLVVGNTLKLAGDRLDGPGVRKVLVPLAAAMTRAAKGDKMVELSTLAAALAAAGRPHGPKATAPQAKAMADLLLSAMERSVNHPHLARMTLALEAVCGCLEPNQAAAVTNRATDHLLVVLRDVRKTRMERDSALTALSHLCNRLDSDQTTRATATLIDLFPLFPGSLSQFSLTLSSLCRRLDGPGAAKLVPALVRAMKLTDAEAGHYVPLQAACERLPAAEAGRTADAMVAAMSQPDLTALTRWSLAMGLEGLKGRLSEAQIDKAVDALITALDRAKEATSLPGDAERLAYCVEVGANPSRLAPRAARAVAAAMTRTDDPTVRYPLLIALGRICLYLGANEGPPLRLNGVKALITSWSNAGAEISSNLAEGLAWQCTTMTTDEIVGLLRHPLAAGDVQAGLLLALSQRCRRTFSSTWQFLDWAEANGIDFTTRT